MDTKDFTSKVELSYNLENELEEAELEPLFYGLHISSPVEEALAKRLEALCCTSSEAEDCAKISRPGDDAIWAYGEVLLLPFMDVLREQCLKKSRTVSMGRFVDLGSGAGRPVLAAALLGKAHSDGGCGFAHCHGIEILEPLHNEARKALNRCRQELADYMANITFECEDLRNSPWWTGTSIAFCNCVTWPTILLDTIGEGAKKLEAGAKLLLVKRELPNSDATLFFKISVVWCDMTWAAGVPIHVYERLPD